MQNQKEWEATVREKEREHRGAIGAESIVMERTCRSNKKKMEMEKKSAISHQKDVEETR